MVAKRQLSRAQSKTKISGDEGKAGRQLLEVRERAVKKPAAMRRQQLSDNSSRETAVEGLIGW